MAIGVTVFRWLATHAAPWIAAFLIGVLWQEARCERAERKAIAEAAEIAAQRVSDASEKTVAAIEAALLSETERLADYERFEAVLRRHAAPAGDCLADGSDAERVRVKVEAANEYGLGGVRGASGGARSADEPRDTAGATPD